MVTEVHTNVTQYFVNIALVSLQQPGIFGLFLVTKWLHFRQIVNITPQNYVGFKFELRAVKPKFFSLICTCWIFCQEETLSSSSP